MDKRILSYGMIAVLVILVLTQTPLVATLLSLLVMGMIPGTNLVIPFWVMLVLYPLLFVAVLYWVSGQRFFIGETGQPTPPASKPKPARKKSATTSRSKRAAPKRRARTAV